MSSLGPDKHRMAEIHESFLADLFKGRRSPGSGNQWRAPADGRNDHTSQWPAFAWDGKSTCGQSISVTRQMWEKIQEQAGGEQPALALRFYGNERLDEVSADLVVISADDFSLLLEAASRSLETVVDSPERDPGDYPQYTVHTYDDGRAPVVYGNDQTLSSPHEIRLEPDETGQIKLYVNDVRVRKGSLTLYKDDVMVGTFMIGTDSE